jgi:hypothetical protein
MMLRQLAHLGLFLGQFTDLDETLGEGLVMGQLLAARRAQAAAGVADLGQIDAIAPQTPTTVAASMPIRELQGVLAGVIVVPLATRRPHGSMGEQQDWRPGSLCRVSTMCRWISTAAISLAGFARHGSIRRPPGRGAPRGS